MNDTITGFLGKGDVTFYNSQRRFLAQHSVAMLEQCCNYSNPCHNNVAMLCCAKNRCCELACKQVVHLGESQEVMREQHAKGDVSVMDAFSDSRFASHAINGELANRLVENHPM